MLAFPFSLVPRLLFRCSSAFEPLFNCLAPPPNNAPLAKGVNTSKNKSLKQKLKLFIATVKFIALNPYGFGRQHVHAHIFAYAGRGECEGAQYLSAVSREQRVANRFECRLRASGLASFVVVRFCQPLVVLSNML